MTMTGQCLQFQELFSPVLDGDANAQERDQLMGHLEQCASCRDEYAEWQRISAILRAPAPEVQAPPDFVRQVMSRLEPVQSSPPARSFQWKSWMPMTAAAALVLFLAGAAGLYSTPGSAPSPTQQAAINDPGQGLPQGTPNPATPAIADSPAGGTPSADPATEAGDKPPVQVAANESAAPQGPTGQPGPLQPSGAAMTLLSSDLLIQSTMLKLDVADLDSTAGAARQAVAAYGGSAVAVGADSQSPRILRLTVAQDKAQRLLANLQAMGSLIESPVKESRNVTAAYQKAQSRIQELTALAAKNPTDAEQYGNELKALEKQLKDWQAEANQHVIVLWLE